MKYILMMNFPNSAWKTSRMELWPEQDRQNHMAYLTRMNQDLQEAGERVDVQGLAGPETAVFVHARHDGTPAVTDGPFAESKEMISYALYDTRTKADAVEWTSRFMALHHELWPGWAGEARVLKVMGPEDFAPPS